MDQSIDPITRTIFTKVTEEIGEHFALAHLIGYTERWRQKTLRIENDQMPPEMTAYAVSLADCDLVCTHPALSTTQRQMAILHEIAHLIRFDIPRSPGSAQLTYQAFVQRREQQARATADTIMHRRLRFFNRYDDPREASAECLARMFMQCMVNYEASGIAKRVYGLEI